MTDSAWLPARLQALRVLPVVVLDHPGRAVDLARALAAGGLGCMEVTLRTQGALDAIAAIADEVPDMLVGAGTVMRPQQVTEAASAGAQFVASPVVDHEVIRRARQIGVGMIPGIERDSDAIAVAREGLRLAKLFTSRRADVQRYARMFRSLRYIPTAGVEAVEMAEFLDEPSVLAVSSSRIAPYGAGVGEVSWLAAEAAAAADRTA